MLLLLPIFLILSKIVKIVKQNNKQKYSKIFLSNTDNIFLIQNKFKVTFLQLKKKKLVFIYHDLQKAKCS